MMGLGKGLVPALKMAILYLFVKSRFHGGQIKCPPQTEGKLTCNWYLTESCSPIGVMFHKNDIG